MCIRDSDDHSDHGHVTPEETIENPAECPADSVISIFHLEEGEYVLEFEEVAHGEEDHDAEDIVMVILKMGGGHAHHDHGDHDDGECHNTDTHENYDLTEAECEAAGHVWMEDDGHDDHDDGECHNTDTHENYDSTAVSYTHSPSPRDATLSRMPSSA